MHTAQYYQQSGKAPAGGLILATVVGAVAASVLAFVYSYVILYLPIAGYITFLLSGGFGFLVGLVTSQLLKAGKIRNTAKGTAIGAVVGLIGFYVAWAVWIYALLRRSDVEITLPEVLLNPAVLWELVNKVNEVGAWNMKGYTPTGIVLWLLWLIEAALILGPAIFLATSALNVFCEGCEAWCETDTAVAMFPNQAGVDVKSWSEKKDFQAFAALGPVGDGTTEFIRLDLHSCPKCSTMNALDVNHVAITYNDKNEAETNVTALVEKLLVDPTDVARIRQLGEKRAVEAAAAPPA